MSRLLNLFGSICQVNCAKNLTFGWIYFFIISQKYFFIYKKGFIFES